MQWLEDEAMLIIIQPFLTVLKRRKPYCPIQKQMQCLAQQVTYEPKLRPTKACQSPLYLRFSSSFKWVAIYWIVCIFYSAYLAITRISAYISGLISFPFITGRLSRTQAISFKNNQIHQSRISLSQANKFKTFLINQDGVRAILSNLGLLQSKQNYTILIRGERGERGKRGERNEKLLTRAKFK